METKPYATYEHPEGQLICQKCNIQMVTKQVTLSYQGAGFPVEMPVCPQCGLYFLPEELVVGEMKRVEAALEDK